MIPAPGEMDNTLQASLMAQQRERVVKGKRNYIWMAEREEEEEAGATADVDE